MVRTHSTLSSRTGVRLHRRKRESLSAVDIPIRKNKTYYLTKNLSIMAQEEKKVYGNKPKVTKETDIKVVEYDYCFNLLQDEKGVRIAVGRQLVSGKTFEDLESAKAYIDSKPWQLIMATAHVCMKIFDKAQAQK